MSSFQYKPDSRRQAYLALVGSIEAQLRDAYAKQNEAGLENQVTIADKLGVNRATVNKRLNGQHKMTIKTIADMAWALSHCIKVDIFDPVERPSNRRDAVSEPGLVSSTPSLGTTTTASSSPSLSTNLTTLVSIK